MYNSISNSQLDLGILAQLSNGNFVLDASTIAIAFLGLAILILSLSILAVIHYKRDKDNIPELRKIEQKIDFYTLDLIRINNRLQNLEDKSGNIDDLHKSILELINLIKGGKNVQN